MRERRSARLCQYDTAWTDDADNVAGFPRQGFPSQEPRYGRQTPGELDKTRKSGKTVPYSSLIKVGPFRIIEVRHAVIHMSIHVDGGHQPA